MAIIAPEALSGVSRSRGPVPASRLRAAHRQGRLDPDDPTALCVFVGGIAWTVAFLHQFQASAAPALRRHRAIRAALVDAALGRSRREPGGYGIGLIVSAWLSVSCWRAARPEDSLRGHVPHDLPLPVRALLRRHRPGLAVDPRPAVRRAGHGARAWGWESFTFDPLYNADIVLYGIIVAGLWQGIGARHVPDAGRPARHRRGYLEGCPRRRHPDLEDLCLDRHPDDAPVFVTTLVIMLTASSSLRSRRRQTGGGPGNCLGSAGEIRLRIHVPGAERRPGHGGRRHDASQRARSSSCPGPISNSDGGGSCPNPADACRHRRRNETPSRSSLAARAAEAESHVLAPHISSTAR